MIRRHDLDWVRVAAFGLLVLYHVGMYYVSWDWHVKSPRPLVALESTIITHGMPWPQNVETARAVEDEIRAAGAGAWAALGLKGQTASSRVPQSRRFGRQSRDPGPVARGRP